MIPHSRLGSQNSLTFLHESYTVVLWKQFNDIILNEKLNSAHKYLPIPRDVNMTLIFSLFQRLISFRLGTEGCTCAAVWHVSMSLFFYENLIHFLITVG